MNFFKFFLQWFQQLKEIWTPTLSFFDIEPEYERLGEEWDFLRQEDHQEEL